MHAYCKHFSSLFLDKSAAEHVIVLLFTQSVWPLFFTYFTDDLPELQEVQDDQSSPAVFQVATGVSHEERPEHGWSPQSESSSISHTNWLTELANIATSPQSPLVQSAPHPRSATCRKFTGECWTDNIMSYEMAISVESLRKDSFKCNIFTTTLFRTFHCNCLFFFYSVCFWKCVLFDFF